MDERMQESNPLGALLSNPALLNTLSGLLGGSSENPLGVNDAEKQTTDALSEGIGNVLSNPEVMAKLPAVMELLKPMLFAPPISSAKQEEKSTDADTTESPHTEAIPAGAFPSFDKTASPRDRSRNDLLLALKPFLSRERCEAVDMILRLSALGAVLHRLR